uniref:acetyl-CoA C-acetyltransferase n=1 Tax=Lotharella globosa TaxID=91324 RepID=A0A6V3NGJ6_9EUKA|mmetsp:Transcript_19264/g.38968  ORF Transcript_19264/g.38968 Transcript_19264/m.38968 type:complete len:411 (-) Transcript_19264:124-1356(-)|eukprot:CAMPEP_0167777290 /NCGR_PEP_ID=MMETSP0111_2-20121227/3611_1 /TAXON_ID=91324 /ORGANISM="Lotharella globosa, Strain CCCM811" /LENGTH=410 /DNA_ID=CAMNT_0007667457 /DNA_START=98 /DNA_END=1330 /DNA_ORIENTATION=+
MLRRSTAACVKARWRSFSTSPRDAVILSAARTPIGSFNGALASLSAPELGAVAIKGAIERAGIEAKDVTETLMGNVLQANIGQAPARQASILGGVPHDAGCTTVNKVCSSGLKAVMFAAQSVMTGQNECVVAGGMESMSNVPLYLGKKVAPYGHDKLQDGLLKDGLWDAFDDHHMGMCAEAIAEEMGFSRQDQDAFCLESYQRVENSSKKGLFDAEIVEVVIPQRRGDPKIIKVDEEYQRLKADKVPSLRPAFKKDGTVTAANASSLNDGAAALIVASRQFAEKNGLTPLATIKGFADAAQEPLKFTTAPSKAIPIALDRAGVSVSDVDFWEINEAFSVVSLANNKLLGLDASKVNVNGGAVGLGHPIGCSGARILVTLLHVLKQNDGKVGVAGICNGGGGASALVVECE